MEQTPLNREERTDMLAIADQTFAEDVDQEFIELLGSLQMPDLDQLDDRKRRALIPFLQIIARGSLDKHNVTDPEARAVAEGMAIWGFQAGWQAARASDVSLLKQE